MTMASSGVIHIVGGLVATRLDSLDATGRSQWSLTAASMSDVPQYNTNNGQWDLITASGAIPPSRNLHSAALGKIGYQKYTLCPLCPRLFINSTNSFFSL